VARFSPTGAVIEARTDYVAPGGLATGPDGSVYIASYGFFSIERLTATDVSTIASFERNSVPGISGTFRPQGVAVARDGTVYAITNGGGGTNDKALVSIARDGTVTPLIVN
jgi:sugar lactone lactonase YvrE